MPAITEDAIRELASFRGGSAPVTTCYLNVDGRNRARPRDYEQELDQLLRGARARANGTRSIADDLARIEAFIRRGFDRSRTKGLAIFSCTERDFWEVVSLPVPVRSQVVISSAPAVSQLERMVHEYNRFGLLILDKQRARMFVFEMGELADHSELFDELPRDYDVTGEQDRGDHRGHVDALASQHVRRAAEVAFHVLREQGFEHFSYSCPDAIASELETALHPYLRERMAPRVSLALGAGLDEVRDAALALEMQVDRVAEADAVARLRAAVATGQRGAGGLAAVLNALNEHRVASLLVSDGFSEPGWRCERCQTLTTIGRMCTGCEGEMSLVEDVVEEAIEEALRQSCEVRLCVGNADLDVLGRVGAILRY